ncbi:MAG: beta-1,3-glucanase family protein, partial [Candidatus Dormibacteraceae bacterium]
MGWVPSEPNYNTLFDWVELAWDNGGNAGLGHKTRLGGNTTQVDMFGMPMHLVLSGQSTTGPGSSTQNAGFMDNRATIRKAYQQLGTKWTNLLITAGNPPRMLRAVSPFHGIQDLKVFPADELDSYINQVFTFYTTNTLSAKASCPQDLGIVHKLAGTVSGGNLVFTDSTGVSFMFPKPSTNRVYENQINAVPTGSELNDCLGRVVGAKLG